jgi:hypothetical protein
MLLLFNRFDTICFLCPSYWMMALRCCFGLVVLGFWILKGTLSVWSLLEFTGRSDAGEPWTAHTKTLDELKFFGAAKAAAFSVELHLFKKKQATNYGSYSAGTCGTHATTWPCHPTTHVQQHEALKTRTRSAYGDRSRTHVPGTVLTR